MNYEISEVPAAEFPALLREIPQPPTTLNFRGQLPDPSFKLLSIVGSRKYTTYGKQVVEELVSGLAGLPIGIVSGLALGIDSLAHEAALKNNIYTLAIPGGGLSDEAIYPAAHKRLAHRILESGGGMLSEFESNFRATKWSFIQRNRLVAGISHATLLIEAASQSGTLTTARMTVDYNRELLVVPGSIFSKNSEGVHQFLKLGAIPVTCTDDILSVLQLKREEKSVEKILVEMSPEEEQIVTLLIEPLHRDELIRKLHIPTNTAAQLLMMMELKGLVSSEQNIYRIR